MPGSVSTIPDLVMPTTSDHAAGWDFSGASSVVTVTGQGISEVTDVTGNGNSLTRTVDGRRPFYGTRTIKGLLVGDFQDDEELHASSVFHRWVPVACHSLTILFSSRAAKAMSSAAVASPAAMAPTWVRASTMISLRVKLKS